MTVASCQTARDMCSMFTNEMLTLPPKPHASMLWLAAVKKEKSDTPPECEERPVKACPFICVERKRQNERTSTTACTLEPTLWEERMR